PEDGCFIYGNLYLLISLGMYLEGARWNSTTHLLDDSRPKQLYTEIPLCWFLPKKNRKKPETVILLTFYFFREFTTAQFIRCFQELVLFQLLVTLLTSLCSWNYLAMILKTNGFVLELLHS